MEYSHAEGYGTAKDSYTATSTDNSLIYTVTTTPSDTDLYSIVSTTSDNPSFAYITAVDVVNKTITLSETIGTLSSKKINVNHYQNAIGKYSHVEGEQARAVGLGAHAEGGKTKAIGKYAHSEGYWGIAQADYSHTEGRSSSALGTGAHAEGNNTRAKGIYSHSEGLNTIASGEYQHVSGKNNVEDLNNTYAEIVGIGTSNTTTNRKNGRTLDWSGNEQLAGSLTLGLGTTNETTVTAAQLKQLIALLGG